MQIPQSDYQDQLVRGMAHRMNNILTLFHGYIGLLLDNQTLDPQTMHGLAKIKEGAISASDLMDRLHSLARPLTPLWREVQLAEFLATMRPALMAHCGQRVTLDFDLSSEVPPVWSDAGRVKTVLNELVKNALEATFTEGGKVVVALRSAPSPAEIDAASSVQWVSLKVTDNGPGLPDGAGDRIFQPFFSTKKRRSSGGLGLTVALTYVQQLGGVLRSRSAPRKTEFEVLLPTRLPAAA
jgi:two-component system cell cycle sensor histidine kinase/response regulator CckA